MSDPQPIEIDVPLTSETGALALVVREIQHREDYTDSTVYPDTDIDIPNRPSTPTSDPLRKIKGSGLTKNVSPQHVKRIPAPPNPDTYIFIRSQSEELIKTLRNRLTEITQPTVGRPPNSKLKEITQLKEQIKIHESEIEKANQALTLARTETAELQHKHFLESLQIITDRDRIILEATEFFHKLVAEAKHKISAIEYDKTRLEEQISQLTIVNHNLDSQLVSFNNQIKTLETEKNPVIEKARSRPTRHFKS